MDKFKTIVKGYFSFSMGLVLLFISFEARWFWAIPFFILGVLFVVAGLVAIFIPDFLTEKEKV